MANFFYRARDTDGAAIDGTLEAVDEDAVINNLSSLGYKVVHIEEKAFGFKDFFASLRRRRKVSQQEILLFVRQTSTMLKSGLPITSTLESVGKQISNEILKDAVEIVLKDIKAGEAFSDALSKHPKVFNELIVSLVRVGETAGILGQVLDRLVIYIEQEIEMKMRLKSATVYPVILVVVAVGIVSFLLVAIIPKFVAIFDTYDADLPIATQSLLFASEIVKRFWYIVLFAVFGLGYWFKKYMESEEGQHKFYSRVLRIPLFGKFYLKVILSRFTRTLGMLVASGVTILDALKVTEKTVGNVVMERVIRRIRSSVAGGQPLSEPFRTTGLFPPMIIQMVTAGEKSGKVDVMLSDVATYYDQEIEYVLKNTATTLEPLLLLFMGGIVAFIALSVLLPIFNLIKVFRGGV